MSNSPSDTSGSGEGMRAVVDYSSFQPRRSEGVPEEHRPYADKVLKMHPFDDVPGNVSDGSNLPNQKPVSIEALSPEMQQEVSRRLLKHAPEERSRHEARYVIEAIRDKRGEIRSMTGLGPDALPYHREQAEIQGQYNELARKRDDLQAELDRVRGHKTEHDEATSEAVPVEIMAITGARRAAYEDQVSELDRQMRLLVAPDGTYGIEATKRLEQALNQSAAQLYRRDQVRAEEAAAQKQFAEKQREERIARRVDALATMSGSRGS